VSGRVASNRIEMTGEIDMSCKAFGLLTGIVVLILILVGLPALLVKLEASTFDCQCSDNTDLFSASVTSDTMFRALVISSPGPLRYQVVTEAVFKVKTVACLWFLWSSYFFD
jgi:hypothetical protein